MGNADAWVYFPWNLPPPDLAASSAWLHRVMQINIDLGKEKTLWQQNKLNSVKTEWIYKGGQGNPLI